MAQIETYRARQGLSPSSTPRVAVDNSLANAIQDVGASVTEGASALIQRQKDKENFVAENGYRRLRLELQNDLDNSAQTIQPGGAGFHDAFITDIYRPKRDAFLSTLPPELRPRFEEVLADGTGADFAEWSTSAATVERDEGYRWTKQELGATQEQLAQAIAIDPTVFEDYMAAGEALIADAPLPTPERELLRTEWRQMAQIASLDAMMQTDPQGVLRVLGVDARQLSPTTQFQVLSRAVQWQESTDNPDAVSPKGAVGLMQVMPATAREIAAAMGDEQFPTGENDAVISAYLSNPYVNKRYGEEYLRQQLRTFGNTRNPIETALVAYNGGPSVAQRWVESGYDDSVLSKETRDYKAAIMASISSPAASGDPGRVQYTSGDGSGAVDLAGVTPELTDRVSVAFASLGIDRVRVNSAHRDAEHNAAVGGANDSEHTRGNALDINVAGMSHAERVEVIKAMSAAGVTGIGVYANTIHADIGGRRAWGPDYSSGSVPKWAQGVIAEHLNGTTPPVRRVADAYGDLPYNRRQQYLAAADQTISQQLADASKASTAQVVATRRAVENEIATIRTTGVPSGQFDDTTVSTILGESAYLEYVDKRDLAHRTYTATHDIPTLTSEEMTRRIEDYAPVPGSGDFARQQEVQASVQREVERAIKLRSTDPAQAALGIPAVKAAWDALNMAEAPEPTQVQGFVTLMLETQAQFDIAPAARAPVPSNWAVEIGRSLSRVPEPVGRNIEDVRYNIQAQYNSLQQFFGEYTDEVIIHSLAEYKGVSATTAEVINGYMQAIQAGGDPFRSRGPSIGQAEDMDQVDSLSLYRESMIENYNRALAPFFPGAGDATNADTGMSPEEMLRAATPEE